MPNPKNNSKNLIASSKDAELRDRITVLAADAGITNPQAWVDANMLAIVSIDVDSSGNTVAYNYGYADDERAKKIKAAKEAYEQAQKEEAPGKNRAAVTDDNIRNAITKVKASQSSIAKA